ncbi:MAG: glycerophosphodiester phosphodiesterase family protein [Acidocella sp.]|nr:glycerophosphodiester phosphodiesterase family protein [Acidocella sp.]
MRLYGHRGARGERPENTLAGFHHACALGLAGIETDIALTADLTPVLHHDPELPDGRPIRAMALADLPGHIPTLAQALTEIPCPLWLLEVKTFPPTPDRAHDPALMVRQILAVLAASPARQISLLAFDWAVLRAAAEQAPKLPRICLTNAQTAQDRDLWWGTGYGHLSIPAAVAATGAIGWAAHHASLTEPEIIEAHKRGLDVTAWTVNEHTDFNRLAGVVDGIITDHPSRFIAS